MPVETKFPIEHSDELFCEFNGAERRNYLLWLQGWRPERQLSTVRGVNGFSGTGVSRTLTNWCPRCQEYTPQNHEHGFAGSVASREKRTLTTLSVLFPHDEPLFALRDKLRSELAIVVSNIRKISAPVLFIAPDLKSWFEVPDEPLFALNTLEFHAVRHELRKKTSPEKFYNAGKP